MSTRDLGEDCIEEHPRFFLDLYLLCVRTDSAATRSISDERHDDMKHIYGEVWNPKTPKPKKIWHLRDCLGLTQINTNRAPSNLSFRYGDPETVALYCVLESPV